MVQLLLAVIYVSFVSLGLPDALLGSAWPMIYPELSVPVSYAGIISAIISVGTITSSLFCNRLTYKLGTGKLTALCVALTALALFGFSLSRSFWMLCLCAIPYGLGAGSVDASLNNYVALHYASRHVSWLHCMWGVGASVGPYIMGSALTNGMSWNAGYRYIALLQVVLTAILLFSLPMWRKNEEQSGKKEEKPLPLSAIMRIPGAKEVFVVFFCFCGLEQTIGLWASSYLVLWRGVDVTRAATFASLFFTGITIGRALSGFLTIRLKDLQVIRLGLAVMTTGLLLFFLPVGEFCALLALILVGLGYAPLYPCTVHVTPLLFGEARSQAIVGIQTACGYAGVCLMPPLFGLIANHVSIGLFPVCIALQLGIMALMHFRLVRKTARSHNVML